MKELDLIYSRHNTDAKATKISASAIRFYDLTMILRGTLCYSINGEKTIIKQGDIICLPPGTMRSRHEGNEKSDFISFNFTSKNEIAIPTILEKAVSNDMLLLVAAYDEICRNSYLDNKEKSAHLLSCLLLILEDRVAQTRRNPLAIKIIEFIHKNFAQKITLDKIGKAMFFSPGYCDNIFRRETGRSIIDYLIEIRITEAKRLIFEGEISLSAVSEAVGFDDYNYFSRVFKKRTGYTPNEYRKLTASDAPPFSSIK